ncbi:hypothetical protein [Mycetocola saprophilus]|uniref:hypothetical protein n=1 Tax=Mycetocola saprophilus TaxID=76636 RepID=UPI003BF2E37E
MVRRAMVRGAMVFDPTRRDEVEDTLRRLRRPTLLLVSDTDAWGRSDPLRAMARAWSILTEDDARSVFVIRDAVHPLPGGVDRAVSALRRVPPESGIALHTAADSPHNAFRVRLAALTGHGLVELVPEERAPTLFLLFDGADASRIARVLAGRGGTDVEAERVLADTLHALGIRVFAVVPHPLERADAVGPAPVAEEHARATLVCAEHARATLVAVGADRQSWAVLSSPTVEGIACGWIPVYQHGRTRLERYIGSPEGPRNRQEAPWFRAADLLAASDLRDLIAPRPGVDADHEAFVAGVLLGWSARRVPRAGVELRDDRLWALARTWAHASAPTESAARIEELASRIRAGITAVAEKPGEA